MYVRNATCGGAMPSRKVTERDLIRALRDVNKLDNPNPNRQGCPDRIVLENLASASPNEVRVEESTLLHLGSCWPCASDLKALRENARSRKK
jgi:hypothetical protein